MHCQHALGSHQQQRPAEAAATSCLQQRVRRCSRTTGAPPSGRRLRIAIAANSGRSNGGAANTATQVLEWHTVGQPTLWQVCVLVGVGGGKGRACCGDEPLSPMTATQPTSTSCTHTLKKPWPRRQNASCLHAQGSAGSVLSEGSPAARLTPAWRVRGCLERVVGLYAFFVLSSRKPRHFACVQGLAALRESATTKNHHPSLSPPLMNRCCC